MLPRIEPTIEALTTSCRPWPRAKRAMISSGALPKVTLSRPPIPGPERAASSSVARPISAAVGMMPSAAATKTSPAPASRELERDRRRDQRHQQVGPAVRAAQEGGVQPGRSAAFHRRATGASWRSSAGRPGSTRPGRIRCIRSGCRRRRRAAADTRQFGAGRAAELFEQPAQPGAALRALEQFDRVDPELLEEVVERLGAVRGRDLLFLVDAVQREVDFDLHLFAGAFGLDVEFGGEAADDLVVADVDVRVGGLQRLFDFALGLFEFAEGQRAGGFELRAAGRDFGQFGDRFERAADVEVAADLGRFGAADVGGAFVGQVVDEVFGAELAGRFFLALGRALGPAFGAAFAAALLRSPTGRS